MYEKIQAQRGKEYKDLITRLNKIEGQLWGIKKVVEDAAVFPTATS